MNKLKTIFNKAPIVSSIFLVVFGVTIIIVYWLSGLHHLNAVATHPTIIEDIKIDEAGEFTWKVPDGTWNARKGEGRVSLVLKKVQQFKGEDLNNREKRPLKLKIAVYASQKNGERIDRLIKNWYFITDEPFSAAGSRLWSSWGNDKFEYGLAGIWAYPRENVFINMKILTPDPVLQNGKPQLKISGNYDYAAVPFVLLFIYTGYGILFILISILLFLSCMIWKKIEILET